MVIHLEKKPTTSKAVPPLTARPLDLLYAIFFAFHIPASIFLDLQYFYPKWTIPPFMRSLIPLYVQMSNDPLVGGLAGFFGDNSHLLWFKTFLYLEALFQVPVFFIGLYGLYKGSKSIYVLLIIYGASTATTTLPCILYFLQVPRLASGVLATPGVESLTTEQLILLLSSYIPFFLIPLLMAVDMAYRVLGLVKTGVKAEKWE